MKIVGAHAILYTKIEGRDGDMTIGILLQKRNAKAKIYPGYWGCSGGCVDEGELPINAVIREITEELDINNVEFEDRVEEIPIWRGDREFSMLFHSARFEGSFNLRGDESQGIALFNPEEINHIMLRPEDRLAISRFLQRGI